MKSGSVLVVGLVIMVFLALTVLLMLAIYGQMTVPLVHSNPSFKIETSTELLNSF
ncbi:MAG: hypothetical protein H5T94_04240 [Pseudothermotoga sp.]|nr:hypothetical protein [Pseudothermotoga sp.]